MTNEITNHMYDIIRKAKAEERERICLLLLREVDKYSDKTYESRFHLMVDKICEEVSDE